MLQSDSPVAFFDSGIGGLTAVSEFVKILPNENVVYFADTLNMPYGHKTEKEIFSFTVRALNFLEKLCPKLFFVACGTASSVLLKSSIQKIGFGAPVVNVVESACFAAANLTKTKRIGIIGTVATIKAGVFANNLKLIDSSLEVYCKACPKLASIVEESMCENATCQRKNISGILSEYLSYFEDKDIDVLLLGCTHYSIIKNYIADYLGPKVHLIDVGKEASKAAANVLGNSGLVNSKVSSGYFKAFVTKGRKEFYAKAKQVLKGCEFSSFSVKKVGEGVNVV